MIIPDKQVYITWWALFSNVQLNYENCTLIVHKLRENLNHTCSCSTTMPDRIKQKQSWIRVQAKYLYV